MPEWQCGERIAHGRSARPCRPGRGSSTMIPKWSAGWRSARGLHLIDQQRIHLARPCRQTAIADLRGIDHGHARQIKPIAKLVQLTATPRLLVGLPKRPSTIAKVACAGAMGERFTTRFGVISQLSRCRELAPVAALAPSRRGNDAVAWKCCNCCPRPESRARSSPTDWLSIHARMNRPDR